KLAGSRAKKSYVTREETNAIISQGIKRALKKGNRKKRRRRANSDSDSESSEESHVVNTIEKKVKSYLHSRSRKRHKKHSHSAEVVGYVSLEHGSSKVMRILVDSGSTSTIILIRFCDPNLTSKYKETPLNWRTLGGVFTTRRKALVKFRLPEFSTKKQIQWKCHVDDKTDPKIARYDMIMGKDLQEELGIVINWQNCTIVWDDVPIAMKKYGSLHSRTKAKELFQTAMEPESIQHANKRVTRILDAKYEAADLRQVVAKCCSHLSANERSKLLKLLKDYEHVFDGTLGSFRTSPVSLELKKDAKPSHSRAFPVPRVREETLRKEVSRLVSIGVLEKCGPSEWAAPTFIIPKKNGSVRFISDFRQLNARLKRKAFPLPK
ncbi:MAG: hypothetical protein ACREBR_04040, partial [bacterium]